MTVKELIEKLEKMPPDSEVVVVHSEWPIKHVDFVIAPSGPRVEIR